MRSTTAGIFPIRGAGCVAVIACLVSCSVLSAQDSAADNTNHTHLDFPASESLLRLSVMAPKEVRAGDSFTYEIHVTNASDNVVLHDVRFAQTKGGEFHVESSQWLGQSDGNDESSSGQASKNESESSQRPPDDQSAGQQQPSSEAQDGESARRGENARQTDQEKEGKQAQEVQGDERQDSSVKSQNGIDRSDSNRRENAQSKQPKEPKDTWTIKTLSPGETRRLQVTAAADGEGAQPICLSLVSYRSMLCASIEVVKPELELTKRAPETVMACEEIEFEYIVSNTGTGELERFEIVDKLPDGLSTITGDEQLRFDVDRLREGESRKFVANLIAFQGGEFSSRAVATTADGKKTRSQRTTTTVQAADLDLAVEGPGVEYVRRPMAYTLKVTNRGKAEVSDARLTFAYPADIRLVRQGEWRETEAKQTAASSNQSPTPADRDAREARPLGAGDPADEPQSDQQTVSQQEMESTGWTIERLESGKTLVLNVVFRARQQGTFPFRAAIAHRCLPNAERLQVVARGAMTTEVVALPALHITVIDSKDPVAIDEEVEYTIRLVNEGNAAAKNVKISTQLPQQLEFVEASGETEGAHEGERVTFQPIESLEPGDDARWSLKVKAKEKGSIRLTAEVSSDFLDQPVKTEEPTNVFQGDQ